MYADLRNSDISCLQTLGKDSGQASSGGDGLCFAEGVLERCSPVRGWARERIYSCFGRARPRAGLGQADGEATQAQIRQP